MKVKSDLLNSLEKITELEKVIDTNKNARLGKSVHELLKLKYKITKIKPPY